MGKNCVYEIKTDKISANNMKFTVINKHPKYAKGNEGFAKVEIEKQLYKVFKKYA